MSLGSQVKKQPFNLQIRSNYFKQCKQIKKMAKKKKYQYKKEFFDKLLNWKETDPKKYWEVLNSFKKNNNPNNKVEIQHNFNQLIDHFKSQGKSDKYNVNFKNKIENYITQYKDFLAENQTTDKPFTVSEIKQCIKALKSNKSPGPDLICNEILKNSSVVTCKAIVKLFNLILDSDKYPYAWRHSFIIPLHKSGNKNDLNNYRGISLQNCIEKLFSSALNKRLMTHYEDLFSKHQFGFRANHRTSDSLFILKTLITKYVLNKNKKIYSCFVDLRKAFDTGLLYKLLTNNIGCKFCNVIQNIYSLCHSAIKIHNKHSDYFKIERG